MSIAKAASDRRRILVVEDHDMISDMLFDVLSDRYEVTRADRVATALERIAEQRHDVILLDYCLPDGTGHQVGTCADAMGIPVIWMSGDADAIEGTGSDYILPKPFRIEHVEAAVASVFDRDCAVRRTVSA